jgi:hypothetical protein
VKTSWAQLSKMEELEAKAAKDFARALELEPQLVALHRWLWTACAPASHRSPRARPEPRSQGPSSPLEASLRSDGRGSSDRVGSCEWLLVAFDGDGRGIRMDASGKWRSWLPTVRKRKISVSGTGSSLRPSASKPFTNAYSVL